jgi:hypothetical protein
VVQQRDIRPWLDYWCLNISSVIVTIVVVIIIIIIIAIITCFSVSY